MATDLDRPTCCGRPMLPIVTHNRTKQRGFKPVRHPDGTWTMHRPNHAGPITPAT